MAGTLAGPARLRKLSESLAVGKGSARVSRAGETVPVSRTLEDRVPRAALQPTKGFHEFFCLRFRGAQAGSLQVSAACRDPREIQYMDYALDVAGKLPATAGSLRSPMWNPLRARMKFPMDRFQALLINVRVNLGRRDVGVAEHLLDDAQISAVAE